MNNTSRRLTEERLKFLDNVSQTKIKELNSQYPDISRIIYQIKEFGNKSLHAKILKSFALDMDNHKLNNNDKVFLNDLMQCIGIIIRLMDKVKKLNSKEYQEVIESFIEIRILKDNTPIIEYDVDMCAPAQDLIVVKDINNKGKLKLTYHDYDYHTANDYSNGINISIVNNLPKKIFNDNEIVDAILKTTDSVIFHHMDNAVRYGDFIKNNYDNNTDRKKSTIFGITNPYNEYKHQEQLQRLT